MQQRQLQKEIKAAKTTIIDQMKGKASSFETQLKDHITELNTFANCAVQRLNGHLVR